MANSIKREIGQHFVFGFHGHDVGGEVRALITDYYIGNIILMKRNAQDAKQVRQLVANLQQIAKDAGHEKPLLIGIDQENGLVSAFSSRTAGTQFPGAMALSATGSPDTAFEVSAASAKELKLVGINWAFSPVADVNSDPRNPVIGVRSFGDGGTAILTGYKHPQDVGRFTVAVAMGLSSSGVAPSAKHFPGHGDTHVDSHLALPRIMKYEEEILNAELVPFMKLIEAGVATIMTGHMALPLITDSDTPSSLSKLITTGFLREKLNYSGVIVTDCLEMDAIADPDQGGCGIPEGAVSALEAGADIVMACHTFEQQKLAVEKVYEAINSGRLQQNALMQSGQRISTLKDVYAGTWKSLEASYNDSSFDDSWKTVKETNLNLARDVYSRTTAMVWNDNHVLPLKKIAKSSGVLLLTPQAESINRAVDTDEDMAVTNADGTIRNTTGAFYHSLGQSLGQRSKYRHIVYAENDRPEKWIGEMDAVVFVTRNADRATWQKQYLANVLAILRQEDKNLAKPVVIIASCGPYDLVCSKELDLSGTAYIATFEYTAPALEIATGIIFGEKKATGRVPVLGGQLDDR
ncbi:glycoside hydrolase [Cyathus striatus]|nr:glycoside hydrolase [Cyathus striatus]